MIKLLKIMVKMLLIYIVVVSSIIYIVDRNNDGDKTILRCVGEAVSYTYNEMDKSLDKHDIDLDESIDKTKKEWGRTKLGDKKDFKKGMNKKFD